MVNQPFVFGWHDGALYVQAFPVLEDDQREHPKAADTLLNAAISDEMWQKVKQHDAAVDLELVNATGRQAARHRAAGVEGRRSTVDGFVASARHVENRVPEGANWNGSEEMLVHRRGVRRLRAPERRCRRSRHRRRTKKTATKPAHASGARRAAGVALTALPSRLKR